jgi:hypothetical protein
LDEGTNGLLEEHCQLPGGFESFMHLDYTNKKNTGEPDCRPASVLIGCDARKDRSNECTGSTQRCDGLFLGISDLSATEVVA